MPARTVPHRRCLLRPVWPRLLQRHHRRRLRLLKQLLRPSATPLNLPRWPLRAHRAMPRPLKQRLRLSRWKPSRLKRLLSRPSNRQKQHNKRLKMSGLLRRPRRLMLRLSEVRHNTLNPRRRLGVTRLRRIRPRPSRHKLTRRLRGLRLRLRKPVRRVSVQTRRRLRPMRSQFVIKP